MRRKGGEVQDSGGEKLPNKNQGNHGVFKIREEGIMLLQRPSSIIVQHTCPSPETTTSRKGGEVQDSGGEKLPNKNLGDNGVFMIREEGIALLQRPSLIIVLPHVRR
jgi:hypothetical protein